MTRWQDDKMTRWPHAAPPASSASLSGGSIPTSIASSQTDHQDDQLLLLHRSLCPRDGIMTAAGDKLPKGSNQQEEKEPKHFSPVNATMENNDVKFVKDTHFTAWRFLKNIHWNPPLHISKFIHFDCIQYLKTFCQLCSCNKIFSDAAQIFSDVAP